MNIRILFVIPYFYPAESFGGPVRVALDVAKELVRLGHEVVVYTSDAKDMKNRLNITTAVIDGIKVKYFSNLSMRLVESSKLFVTLQMISEIKKELRQFDVIHIHEFTTFQNIIIHRFAKKYFIPYVLQAHGSLPRTDRQVRKWVFERLFGLSILRDASRVIALNEIESMQYEKKGVPIDKIKIVPNAINVEDYANLPSKNCFKKRFKIPFDAKLVLYLGRLHISKRIDLLIQAYSVLLGKEGYPRTFLVIAGPDDGFLIEAKTLVNSLKISDQVLFTGFIDINDKLAALVDANMLVTPSYSGFPVTFLEACSVGTPLITTTLGDHMDWLNEQVGLVTAPTPSDLSKAIGLVLTDNELSAKFSHNCKRIATEMFSLKVIVNKLEHIYKEAIIEG